MAKKFTDEEKKNIIEDYLSNNFLLKDIAIKYNRNRGCIQEMLIGNNITLKRKHVTKEQHKEIVELYKSGVSVIKVAKLLNLSGTCIIEQLKKAKIKLRSGKINGRKWNIVNNYFENIDTQEKAYLLGLLYADGNVATNQPVIKLSLIDKEVVEWFGKQLILNYSDEVIKIRTDSSYNKISNKIHKLQYHLSINSKQIKDDLIKYGCMPNKTFKIRLPKFENEDMYRHFIRGYFDGDGCITIPNKYYRNSSASFLSNETFCLEMIQKIGEQTGIYPKIYNKKNIIKSVYITGMKRLKIFYNYLYKDAIFSMQRKKEKFELLFGKI